MVRRDGVGRHARRHHRDENTLGREQRQESPLQRRIELVEQIGGRQDLADRIHVQGGCERCRVAARFGRLLVAEIDLRHACDLVAKARLDTFPADQVEVREDRGNHVVGMRDSGLGCLDRDAEGREVRVPESGSRAQTFRPPLRLQRREQTPPAFVAEKMRDEGERMGPVVRAQRRNREGERDGAQLADRLDFEPRGQRPVAVERRVDAQALHVAPLHLLEP